MAEQRQTYTLDAQTGQALTVTQDGITMPADNGFACVNDYVHAPERHFEELQWLALGMANEIDRLRNFERICDGLSQDCIDGGYTVSEHRLHCKQVEDERDLLRSELATVKKVAYGNIALLDENTTLRGRIADLLHLLQYATITTPSNGDAEQAKVVMSELARMLATEQAPSARQQSEQARYRYLRDHCAREWDIHDYQEVLISIPCGPSIAHCDDLDAIVDAAIAAKEASHA